jgi:hypothetical protein
MQPRYKTPPDESFDIDDGALNLILSETRGYPCFQQEWSKHSWNAAHESAQLLPSFVTVTDYIRHWLMSVRMNMNDNLMK